jgi:hypothetical protein
LSLPSMGSVEFRPLQQEPIIIVFAEFNFLLKVDEPIAPLSPRTTILSGWGFVYGETEMERR